jgi:redox-sensitive bicupin YhaK (pirin superfamily)
MSIRIISKEQQGYGAFNGGEIVENKPIGFPQDRSTIRPYSNLFYWAHAKALTDSTIGLHPHQGFEICSFVLKGMIRHYDTKLQSWRSLSIGDVQIIRAGNGISHSEWMGENAEMFQIWFDPNLNKTLAQPASYDDYKAAEFPITTLDNTTITTLVGDGSPFTMDTAGIDVLDIRMQSGTYELPIPTGKIGSAYLLDGDASFDGQLVKTSDFVLIDGQETLNMVANNSARIFIILSPAQPSYKTYAQIRH